ncbi:ATP-binding protein [Bacillus pumilus]|uniref:ATP-binding protein n=1 Tax=Bacillus pumilus TaxID=1408 RepID=UPI002ABD4FA3|nr:ATP-binding protein [Bacillus pumilus]
MLEVRMPKYFTRETMEYVITQIINSDLMPRSQEIKLNFSQLEFIEPAGVTILRNLVKWLQVRNVAITISYPPQSTNGTKFLDDAMFFFALTNRLLYPGSFVRPTTLQLQDVTYEISHQWLDTNFVPWLSGRTNLPLFSFNDIKMCFGEIFNNIKDHANENIGCIFAQHFPNIKKIKISISDFGVGIPNTIRRIHPLLNDSQALELAIQEGISSESQPSNRGAGLHTLIHNVVLNYNGEVQIRSFNGVLTCEKNEDGHIRVNSYKNKGVYPGTFIEVILDTEQFSEVYNEEEEFEWGL